jgi:hypothetical protein
MVVCCAAQIIGSPIDADPLFAALQHIGANFKPPAYPVEIDDRSCPVCSQPV